MHIVLVRVRKLISINCHPRIRVLTGAHRFEGLKLKEADDIEDNIEKKGLGTSSPMSVQAVLFLHTRPMTLQHGGTLLYIKCFIKYLLHTHNFINQSQFD